MYYQTQTNFHLQTQMVFHLYVSRTPNTIRNIPLRNIPFLDKFALVGSILKTNFQKIIWTFYREKLPQIAFKPLWMLTLRVEGGQNVSSRSDLTNKVLELLVIQFQIPLSLLITQSLGRSIQFLGNHISSHFPVWSDNMCLSSIKSFLIVYCLSKT